MFFCKIWIECSKITTCWREQEFSAIWLHLLVQLTWDISTGSSMNILPVYFHNQKLRILTYLLTYGAEPFLRNYQLWSHSRTSQHFKEPEGSSPCSQKPHAGPYPKPDRSSPYHPILSLLRSILALSTHLRLGRPSGLFPSGFPTNILYSCG
jgi:hypothetical protein